MTFDDVCTGMLSEIRSGFNAICLPIIDYDCAQLLGISSENRHCSERPTLHIVEPGEIRLYSSKLF